MSDAQMRTWAEIDLGRLKHNYTALREQLGRDTAVAAVMSGNWVQQGRPAVTDKWTRARMALNGGVDLVLELPTVWAASSAESFARGAVALMCRSGVVDTLCFGSETGELSSLQAAADCLDSPDYPAQLRRALEGGASFAAARQAAVERLIGPAGTALASPNNNLGVEYLRSLRALGSAIRPVTVRREGAAHNSLGKTGEGFRSATQLRQHLARGAGDAGLSAEDEGGGLGQAARCRSRGGPAPAIRAGGAAVS